MSRIAQTNLTPREREVWDLVKAKVAPRFIARRLGISQQAVSQFLKSATLRQGLERVKKEQIDWNDKTIVRLRSLWNEGLSTAEIGRRIGVSKNAVVGKAHRLGLSARPSPIRRGGPGVAAPRPAAPRRIVGPTLPPLAATLPSAEEVPRSGRPVAKPLAEVAVTTAAPIVAAAPAPVRVVPPRPSRLAACCWPLGEPGTKSFHFCDAEALTGKPYCAEHAQLAYVKVRDRREEAAA